MEQTMPEVHLEVAQADSAHVDGETEKGEPKVYPNAPSRSELFDWVFALFFLFAAIAALVLPFVLSNVDQIYKTIAIAYAGCWLFLVVRLHLHIWWLNGLPAFCHLTSRLPCTWINTMVFLPTFVVLKLFQFVLVEIFLLDPVGQLYKCAGKGLTIARYARMCKDLNKPLIFRTPGTKLKFTIYPHMLSTELACNVYSLGPYTGFGILTILFSDTHVVFRNGLFGTHPAYNYHVTLFFNKGDLYWHTAHALLPASGAFTIYRRLWNWYAEHMIEVIEESEHRTKNAIQAPNTDLLATWPASTESLLCNKPLTERQHVIEAIQPLKSE